MRPRPTQRGRGLAAAAAVLLAAGLGLGAIDLLRAGVLLALVVLGGFALLLLPAPGRGALSVLRTTRPDPVHAGRHAQIEVEVTAGTPAARRTLADLRFTERASGDLTGGTPLRATVSRSPGRVLVRYSVPAARRGRWPVGPLMVSRSDPAGVAHVSGPLGTTSTVTVWPAVTALPPWRDLLAAEPERVATGLRSPGPDDAALRDYRDGDDLRRVHWRSTARRGRLIVRGDEHTSVRPVALVLGVPVQPVPLEWAVELVASLAVAALSGGHAVHLHTGDGEAVIAAAGTGLLGEAALLDALVDVTASRNSAHAADRLGAAVRQVAEVGSTGRLVLAVLGHGTHPDLAHLVEAGPAWAWVRTDPARRADDATLQTLRRAGWRAVGVTTRMGPLASWEHLQEVRA